MPSKIQQNEGTLSLACNDRKAFFFNSTDHRGYTLWSCQNVCDVFSYFLIIFTSDLVISCTGKIVGIPMGTNCAPLVAELFLFV